MCSSLGCGALSARRIYWRVHCLWVFSGSLGVTLDSAQTPFAKPPLSWFLNLFEVILCSAGNLEPRFGDHDLQTLGLGRQEIASRNGWSLLKCAQKRWNLRSPHRKLKGRKIAHNLEGPTRKPRHASVFSTHSDMQAVPAVYECKKALFSTRAFSKRTDTLSTIA